MKNIYTLLLLGISAGYREIEPCLIKFSVHTKVSHRRIHFHMFRNSGAGKFLPVSILSSCSLIYRVKRKEIMKKIAAG